jgi:hypothetical protein
MLIIDLKILHNTNLYLSLQRFDGAHYTGKSFHKVLVKHAMQKERRSTVCNQSFSL